jgi:opacity protein-like surface antigen
LVPVLGAAEKFSLRLSYGTSTIGPSDLNDFLADFVRIRRDIGYILPAAGLKPLKWTDDAELTLSMSLGDRVSVFASAGFVAAQQVGNDIAFTIGSGYGTFYRNDRIRSFAVRMGLSYALPLSASIVVRPHASVDGYWSSFQDDGSQTYGGSGWPEDTELEWIAETKAFNFGWTLGASLEVAVWSKLSLSLDAGWRQARLSGFTGNYQRIDYGVPAAPQEFRLFYFEQKSDWPGGTYKALNLPGTFGGSTVTVSRDAMLDLSGFYASAGIDRKSVV